MRKSKLKNGIMLAVMAVVMTITGFGVAEKTAKANTTDRSWSFSLSVQSSGFNYISKQKKDNNSKIYFYWSTTYGGNLTKLTVSPYGANEGTGYLPAGYVYRQNGSLVGYRKDYTVPYTGKYAITNFVNELGYTYASVGVASALGSGTAKGLWSPDCAGSYTVLQ